MSLRQTVNPILFLVALLILCFAFNMVSTTDTPLFAHSHPPELECPPECIDPPPFRTLTASADDDWCHDCVGA